MNRLGSVIIFKEGVTPEQAEAALESIRDVLDLPEEVSKPVPAGRQFNEELQVWKDCVRYERQPFQMADKIHSFDPTYGGPVWYIP
jgi:hypothetical protein